MKSHILNKFHSLSAISLLTHEYGEQINKLLNNNGIVIINAIAGQQAECRELLAAIDSVYRPHLPNVYWETQSGEAMKRANYILIYSRNDDASVLIKACLSCQTKKRIAIISCR